MFLYYKNQLCMRKCINRNDLVTDRTEPIYFSYLIQLTNKLYEKKTIKSVSTVGCRPLRTLP